MPLCEQCQASKRAGSVKVNFLTEWAGTRTKRHVRACARAQISVWSGEGSAREGYGGASSLRSSTTTELAFLKCNLRVSLLTSAATLRVKYRNKVLRGNKVGQRVGASASD